MEDTMIMNKGNKGNIVSSYKLLDYESKLSTINDLLSLFCDDYSQMKLTSIANFNNQDFGTLEVKSLKLLNEWKDKIEIQLNKFGNSQDFYYHFLYKKRIDKLAAEIGTFTDNIYTIPYYKQEDWQFGIDYFKTIKIEGLEYLVAVTGREILVYNPANEQEILKFTGHIYAVTAILCLNFEKLEKSIIVSISEDSMRIWDCKTEKCSLLKGHKGRVLCLLNVNIEEDNFLISGSSDCTIRVWNLNLNLNLKKNLSLEVIAGHTHKITCLTNLKKSNSNLNLIASGSQDSIRIWDFKNKSIECFECLFILEGHQISIEFLIYVENGNLLVSYGYYDKFIKLWDLNNGELNKEIKTESYVKNQLYFQVGDKNLLAYSSDTQTSNYDTIFIIIILNLDTGLEEKVLEGGHLNTAKLAYVPYKNKHFLISHDVSNKFVIWDLDKGTIYKTIETPKPVTAIKSLNFESETLLAFGTIKNFTFWNFKTESLNFIKDSYTGFQINNFIIYEHLEKLFLILNNSTSIHCWSYDKNFVLKFEKLFTGHTGKICKLIKVHTENKKLFASSGDDNKVIIWNLETKHIEHILEGHDYPVNEIVHFLKQKNLIASLDSYSIKIWNLDFGTCIREFNYDYRINCIASISIDETVFLAYGTGKEDFIIRLLNINNEEDESELILYGHSTDICKILDLSSTLPNLLASMSDSSVRLWNTKTLECLQQISYDSTPVYIFNPPSPHNNLLVISLINRTFVYFDVLTNECVKKSKGIIYQIISGFSAGKIGCSDILFTKDEDGMIQVWDYEGNFITNVHHHKFYVSCIETILFAGKNIFISTSYDNTVKVSLLTYFTKLKSSTHKNFVLHESNLV